MKQVSQKITLDRPVTYQIKVPGHLNESWSDWDGQMAVETACERGGLPVTILTGILDQAGLQGLLRRLYSLGLPLISAIYIEDNSEEQPGS